jgi:hypothetical protein
MRKVLTIGSIGAMALLLSSCFTLQSFILQKGALAPGSSTSVLINVHPYSAVDTTFRKEYQFVLVGVDTPADVSVGTAKWDTKGVFNGPQAMVVQSGLLATIGTSCDGSGFSLSGLSGLTWKGFTTQSAVSDKGLVSKSAQIQVGIKAKGTATADDNVQVVGVTGMWDDATGDGVTGDDTFACTGNGSAELYIK